MHVSPPDPNAALRKGLEVDNLSEAGSATAYPYWPGPSSEDHQQAGYMLVRTAPTNLTPTGGPYMRKNIDTTETTTWASVGYAKASIDFTWARSDEMDQACGDRSKLQDDGSIAGEIRFHPGDESSFIAQPWDSSTAC